MSQPEQIDHSIDVRNEPDTITAFNLFIKKWCGRSYAHLIDSDENDGEFMREKIDQAANKRIVKARISELKDLLHEGVCEYVIGWSKICEIQADCPTIRKRIAKLEKESVQ